MLSWKTVSNMQLTDKKMSKKEGILCNKFNES